MAMEIHSSLELALSGKRFRTLNNVALSAIMWTLSRRDLK